VATTAASHLLLKGAHGLSNRRDTVSSELRASYRPRCIWIQWLISPLRSEGLISGPCKQSWAVGARQMPTQAYIFCGTKCSNRKISNNLYWGITHKGHLQNILEQWN